jgi:hypothetical protein
MEIFGQEFAQAATGLTLQRSCLQRFQEYETIIALSINQSEDIVHVRLDSAE